jgi:hypothetical protein
MASISSDSDIIDLLVGEQGRINAALDQGDVNTTVSDILPLLGDQIGLMDHQAAGVDLLGAPGDMEGPTGLLQTVHNDSLANLNAWSAFGGAPSVAANLVTLTPGQGGLFGHPDWDDGTVTVRFKWNTGAIMWLLWHAQRGQTQNYVFAQAEGANLTLVKNVAGVQTTIANIAAVLTTGTFYWLRVSSTGTTYTVTLFADTAGTLGAQIQTVSGAVTDTQMARGCAGVYNNASSGNVNIGGAFANVLTVTALAPQGWQYQNFYADVASGCWSSASSATGSRSLSVYAPTANAYGAWATYPSGNTGAYTLAVTVWTSGATGVLHQAIDLVTNGGGTGWAADVTVGPTPQQVTVTNTWNAPPGALAVSLGNGSGPSGIVGTIYYDAASVVPTTDISLLAIASTGTTGAYTYDSAGALYGFATYA